jgi:apolipoprotein N-acyltransferase
MTDQPQPATGGNLLPTLVLVVLVALLAGGYFLFPRVAAYMSRQDCIATGHVNCGPS